MNICEMVDLRDKACETLVAMFPEDSILVQRVIDERTQYPEARISSTNFPDAAIWFCVKQQCVTMTLTTHGKADVWADVLRKVFAPVYESQQTENVSTKQ